MSTDTTDPGDKSTADQAEQVLHDAARIANAVAPKYSGEIKLADGLVHAGVHIGIGLAHLFQHWLHHTKSTPSGSK